MATIPLSNGGFAVVDDADVELVSRWKWQRSTNGYARRSTYRGCVLMRYDTPQEASDAYLAWQSAIVPQIAEIIGRAIVSAHAR